MSLVPHDHQEQSPASTGGASDYLTGVGLDPAHVPGVDHQADAHAQAQADIIQPDSHHDGAPMHGTDELGGAPGADHDGGQGHDVGHSDASQGNDHVDMSPPPEPPPDMSHQHG
jgi:hypothetical protein